MKTFIYQMKSGIARTREFERKHLAMYGTNVGIKCGHGCAYCSTPSMVRMHVGFKCLGLSPFDNDYAIVDPTTPHRVAHDARRIKNRGMVQLCTIADAWSPEAQQYQLGRRCLEAILSQPGWTVRILTKNAAVRKDFDVIERYKDRVLVGLSITAPPDKSDIISVIEPNASSIKERIEVMMEVAHRGFRTYAMFCPVLPGIADSPEQIENLVELACQFKAEEIFAEAVNPRGRGLKLTQRALETAGYSNEASAVENIRNRNNWSGYVVRLVRNFQKNVRQLYDINKLRFLLYPSGLVGHDLTQIKQDGGGVTWLGRDEKCQDNER